VLCLYSWCPGVILPFYKQIIIVIFFALSGGEIRVKFGLTLRRTAACRAGQRWGWRERVETGARWWNACCWAARWRDFAATANIYRPKHASKSPHSETTLSNANDTHTRNRRRKSVPKTGTENRNKNKALLYSLPETGTREIWYQIACQTRQKTGIWYVCHWHKYRHFVLRCHLIINSFTAGHSLCGKSSKMRLQIYRKMYTQHTNVFHIMYMLAQNTRPACVIVHILKRPN